MSLGQKQAELELEIARRRALGTPVTVESFLAWRAAFDAEMLAKNGARADDELASKPSGATVMLSCLCCP